MSDQPRHIILIIADSLRYDSVQNAGVLLPYIEAHATTFDEARAAGCWTLPATASIFTGLMPHEHGATEQTRQIHAHLPTLASELKAQGFHTYQVTANVVTTDIFGLNKGFDEVRRIWKMVPPKYSFLQQFVALLGKPRLRKKLFSSDMIMQRLTEDLESSKTWLQYTYDDIFNEARKIIAENDARGQRCFLFLNLMETHFPYHVAPTFEFSKGSLLQKAEEAYSLYHVVNQTFLSAGYQNIRAPMLALLKGRQQLAYEALAPHIDAFCRELHEDRENIVVFGSDHGENFGETGWTYHFSNVTDAGNKVPLYYLPHTSDRTPRTVTTAVSTRHLYDTFLQACGVTTSGASLLSEPERAYSVMSSYWYNNKGQTLPQFKYNQICFLVNDTRYLLRNETWYTAPFATDYDEPNYAAMDKNVLPFEDLSLDTTQKRFLDDTLAQYRGFAKGIKF